MHISTSNLQNSTLHKQWIGFFTFLLLAGCTNNLSSKAPTNYIPLTLPSSAVPGLSSTVQATHFISNVTTTTGQSSSQNQGVAPPVMNIFFDTQKSKDP